MKKIVFMIRNFINAGLERRITNLSNELVKNGYDVIILVTNRIEEESGLQLSDKVKIVLADEEKGTFAEKRLRQRIDSNHPQNDIINDCIISESHQSYRRIIKKRIIQRGYNLLCKSNLFRQMYYKRRYQRVYRNWFVETKPYAVIGFGLPIFQKAYFATLGLGIKVFDAEVLTLQKTMPQDKKGYSFFIKLLRDSNGIIVQTEFEKEFFANESGINVFVINNPIKPDLPIPYQGKREETVVNFCRMNQQKNIELLIDAFIRFHEEFPRYHLHIYGNVQNKEEHEYRKRIIDIINNNHLQDFVFVYPPSSRIHEKVLRSAMFVSSSDYEGLSNSMLEAMAIGLPCVCTDCLGGGTREVMVDHENGLIVPVNDTEALFAAMKEYATSFDLSKKCSENAARIREALSVEKITKQWIQVVENE